MKRGKVINRGQWRKIVENTGLGFNWHGKSLKLEVKFFSKLEIIDEDESQKSTQEKKETKLKKKLKNPKYSGVWVIF